MSGSDDSVDKGQKLTGRKGNEHQHPDQQNTSKSTWSCIEDFVEQNVHQAKKRRIIRKILVSTNGIAAVKCIWSIRSFLMQHFRQDRLIKFICLTTTTEMASNAEYLKMADHVVFSPPGDNKHNYANVDEIVAHAVKEEVDAVWAGWGHASENPELPKMLSEKNICFIGPPSSAMFSLGDKIASTIIAQSLGISTIEWSGSGIMIDSERLKVGDVSISKELFSMATVNDCSSGLLAIETNKIRFPLMIKASEGGGGKGIRKCKTKQDFDECFRQVQAEVPGSPIFLMTCLENARHIEVQLIADRYGCVIPLYTRDCSIQRRCQKIIEEAPACVAPEEVLRKMQEDAVRIAKLVGYESAGTVEYLYLPNEKRYFFLELNPRLQVEHPCTEMIANVNIPAIQLQIAMGLPLSRIMDIRVFYGYKGSQLDDYNLPDDLIKTSVDCHCIAARITSEDPEDFFRPSTGSVETLNFRSAKDVWGYFSISSSGKVHEYADSQFGHLFAVGKTRHIAVSNMLLALKELEVRATFRSQIQYLVELLNEPDFTNNEFNTQWLDNRIANNVATKDTLALHDVIAVSSAVIGHNRISSSFNTFKKAVERGRVIPTKDLTQTYVFDLVKDMKIYKLAVTSSGSSTYYISLNQDSTKVQVYVLGDRRTIVTHKKTSFMCGLEETADKFKVAIGSSVVVFQKDNDPSVLKSPYTGKLLSYKKRNREFVSVGTVYACVESMKLVFDVEVKKTAAPGRLEYVAKEGDLLYPGSIIARLTDQKDSDMFKPKPFVGSFPEWRLSPDDDFIMSNISQFEVCKAECFSILNGFIPPASFYDPKKLVKKLFAHLDDSSLPHDLLNEAVIKLLKLKPELSSLLRNQLERKSMDKFANIKSSIVDYLERLPVSEYKERGICKELLDLCEQFVHGTLSNTVYHLSSLFKHYMDYERFFEGRQYVDAVRLLNEEYVSNKDEVVKVIFAHTQLEARNEFLLAVLDKVEEKIYLVSHLAHYLRGIGNMFHLDEVSEKARQLLLQDNRTKYRKFLNKTIWDLEEISSTERDNLEVLSVYEAVNKLKLLINNKIAAGNTFMQIVEKTPWIHKVFHELFFDDNFADAAVNAYIEKHFIVRGTQKSTLSNLSTETILYDFHVEHEHTGGLTACHANQYLCVVKFSVDFNNFFQTLTNEDLVDRLVDKFLSRQVGSDGLRSVFRLTVLVRAIQPTRQQESSSGERYAQLEELPTIDEQDFHLVNEAERAAVVIQSALSRCLSMVDVSAHVIVCPQYKPLMQVDFPISERLELWRIPSRSQLVSDRLSNLHVYKLDDEKDRKFSKLFAREIVDIPVVSDMNCMDEIEDVISDQLDNACGAIIVTMRKFKKLFFVANHVFLHVTFPKVSPHFTQQHESQLEDCFIDAIRRQRTMLFKHHVTEVEIVVCKLHDNGKQLVKHRVKFLDETGVTPKFGVYDEFDLEIHPLRLSHQLYGETLQVYNPIKKIEKKRLLTRSNGTTYVYDYPKLFGRACLESWKNLEEKISCDGTEQERTMFNKSFSMLTFEQQKAFNNGDYRHFFVVEELVVNNDCLHHIVNKDELKQRADNCSNESAMVAWLLRLYTPEQPLGYSIIVLANDITFQSGSFATQEDKLYNLASKYSRDHKIPRVNVSCNSGARIGLSDAVSKTFRAKFKDPDNPGEGFDYLYLDPAVDQSVKDQVVVETMPNGLLKIKAIIGGEDEDIGVENLQGSGLIAGETSLAYDQIPTYCYVSGRSVGIGAYTARLAHRIVQSRSSHIILTGVLALNTLLGKEVYTSNNQLGGVQIMHNNGVSHAVVDDDFQGICKIVQWLSYLPVESSEYPFVTSFGMDTEERDVIFDISSKAAFDVRMLVDSRDSESMRGICDSNSFDEIMSEWAKTIVAGRARLGGMPIGVILSEFRNVVSVTPADPACPNSRAREVHQAGQVWYPDSAFKTAEVINDFNREKLPLLFIASLRGFSGGQKDMYDMVLKFGAQIVDALRRYTQPVIIYIPAKGELRGGAWAVLDSKINPGIITMVADEESRGGILEPNAIVGIKFREAKLHALQKRNDEILKRLDSEMISEIKLNGHDSQLAKHLEGLIQKRCKELEKPYHKVCVEFADLHDKADRMIAKGAVQHVTNLRKSRSLFINIFKLQTVLLRLVDRYCLAGGNMNREQAYNDVMEAINEFDDNFRHLTPKEAITIVEQFLHSEVFKQKLENKKMETAMKSLANLTIEQRRLLLEQLV